MSKNEGGMAARPRPEARVREDLTEEQREVVEGVQTLVRGMAGQWAGPTPAAAPPLGNPILDELWGVLDPGRSSLTVLIDGARGAGKTTALLTLIDRWLREKGGPDSPAIIPLHALDLRRIGPKSDLLMLLLVRMQWVVQALARTQRTPYTQDELEDAWAGAAQAAIAFRRDGGEYATGESVDVPLAAFELAERAQLSRSLNERFRAFVDKLAAAWRATFGRLPFWVIPVDDADLNPTRTHELLDLIRVLHHPGVAVVITGNYSLFRRALVTSLGNELGVRDRPEENAYVVRLARDILRRTLPPSHAFELPPRTVQEVDEPSPSADLDPGAARAFGLLDTLQQIPLAAPPRADVAALFRRFSPEPAAPGPGVPQEGRPKSQVRLGVLLPASLRRQQDLALELRRLSQTPGVDHAELLHAFLEKVVQEIYLNALDSASKDGSLPSPEALRRTLKGILESELDARAIPTSGATAPRPRRVYVDPTRHAPRMLPGRGDVYSSTGTPESVLLHLDRPPRRLAPKPGELSRTLSDDLGKTLEHPQINALVAAFVGLLSDLAARGAPGIAFARDASRTPRETWVFHSSLEFEGQRLRFPWLLPAWQGTVEAELLGDAWFTVFEAPEFSGWVSSTPGATAALWRAFVESVRLASADSPATAWVAWLADWQTRFAERTTPSPPPTPKPADEAGLFAQGSKEQDQPGASSPWEDWVKTTQLLHLAPEYGLPSEWARGLTEPVTDATRKRLRQLREAAVLEALRRAADERGDPVQTVGEDKVRELLKLLKDRNPGHAWYAYVERALAARERLRTAIGDATAARPTTLGGDHVPFREGALARFCDAYLGSTRRVALLDALDPSAMEAITWQLERSHSAADVLGRLRDLFPGPNVGEVPAPVLEEGPPVLGDDAGRCAVRRPRWPAADRSSASVELLRRLQADVEADEAAHSSAAAKPFWWAGIALDTEPPPGSSWGWPGPRWPAEIDRELVWDHWSSAPEAEALDLDTLARHYLHGMNTVGFNRASPTPGLTLPEWGPLLENVFRQSKRRYAGARWEAWQRWREELVLMAAPPARLRDGVAADLLTHWTAWLRADGREPERVYQELKLPRGTRSAIKRMVRDQPQHPFCVYVGGLLQTSDTEPPE